ncbi:MAG: hypothetical protein SNJ58_05680 [Aggregatilineales bacterium]
MFNQVLQVVMPRPAAAGTIHGHAALTITAFSGGFPEGLRGCLLLGTAICVWLIPRFSHLWLTKATLKALTSLLQRSQQP